MKYYSLFATYPDNLEFHLRSIMERLNNTGSIEISPLCDQKGQLSPLLVPLIEVLQNEDLSIEISQLDDEGSSAVLRVWMQECVLA